MTVFVGYVICSEFSDLERGPRGKAACKMRREGVKRSTAVQSEDLGVTGAGISIMTVWISHSVGYILCNFKARESGRYLKEINQWRETIIEIQGERPWYWIGDVGL
jgi:hypothetical protein